MTIVRYLLGLFRCQGTANQLALSITIGVIMGMTCSVGTSVLFFLPILLIFRLSIPFVCASTGIFWLISTLWLHELAYDIGVYALANNSSWSFFWEKTFQIPILAFFELEKYNVFGSWVLAIIGGILSYLLAYFAVLGLTNSKLTDFFKYNKVSTKVRTKLWNDTDVVGNKIIRPHLTVYVLIFLVLIVAFASLSGSMITKWYINKYINPRLGARVHIVEASFNLLSQKLLISQLKIKNTQNDKDLFTADFLELDFSIASLFKNQFFVTNLKLSGTKLFLSKKENHFNIENLNIFPKLSKTKKRDWSQGLTQLLSIVMKSKDRSSQKRIKEIEDYIFLQTPKNSNMNPMVINALIMEKNENRLLMLTKSKEKEILQLAGKARYINKNPLYRLQKLTIDKLEIEIQDYDHKEKIQKNFELELNLENLNVPTTTLSPTKIKIKIVDLPIAEFRFLHENTTDIWFTSGNADITLQGEYDQGLFNASGKAMLKNAKLLSTDTAIIFKSNAREFLWGLNKAENFSSSFEIKGTKNIWELKINQEELEEVSKTANSNLESVIK